MDDKELDKLFGIDPEEDKAGSKEQNAPAADDAVQKPEEESGDKKEEPAKEEEHKPEEGAAEEPEAEIEDEEESEAEPDAAKDVKEHDKKPIKKAAVRREEPFVKPAEDVSFRDMIPFSNATIAAFILGLAFIAMVLCILFLPAFRVKTVNIEGNVVLSDEEILSMTGLSYGDHILSGVSGNIFDLLSLNYGKTEQAIMEKNPYVESITISVKIPSTINIEIKERQKIAYIKTADGYLAIDRDGIVLELSSADNASEVRPVICGMEIDSAVLGEKLTIKNMNAFKKAIIVMGAILNADNA